MSLWSWWVRLADWLVRPERDRGEEELQITRQRQLSMAVPFPELDWSGDAGREAESLKTLHDYAVALANSAIDWYVRKRQWKKCWSIILRFLIFLFAIIGILIPLVHILCPEWPADVIKWLCPHLTGDLTGFSAEAALVFIGIAAGFNLIDRLAGFSTGWMRYMTSAMLANRALLLFELRWNWLARNAHLVRRPVDVTETLATGLVVPESLDGGGPLAPGDADASSDRDWARDPIMLVWTLCRQLLAIVDQETNEWSTELKNSISHLNEHVTGFGRSGGKAPS